MSTGRLCCLQVVGNYIWVEGGVFWIVRSISVSREEIHCQALASSFSPSKKTVVEILSKEDLALAELRTSPLPPHWPALPCCLHCEAGAHNFAHILMLTCKAAAICNN